MVDSDRLLAAYQTARADLLSECDLAGHWAGQLASSPFATAAAVSALTLVEQHAAVNARGRFADEFRESCLSELRVASVHWLARHQNADGGWGDAEQSPSNIAASLTVRAALQLTGVPAADGSLLEAADAYIAWAGGAAGLRQYYARDKTAAAAVLTNAAIAELIPWRRVPALPFDWTCLPRSYWRWARLPVLSCCIPALLAAGQARFYHCPPINPVRRWLRGRALPTCLRLLERMQPVSGGYLESVPLTALVVMSLAGSGKTGNPIVHRGVDFLLDTVRARTAAGRSRRTCRFAIPRRPSTRYRSVARTSAGSNVSIGC